MKAHEREMSSIVDALGKFTMGGNLKSLSYVTSYTDKDKFPARVTGVMYDKSGKRMTFEILFNLPEEDDIDSEYEFNLHSLRVRVVMARLDGFKGCVHSDGQWI